MLDMCCSDDGQAIDNYLIQNLRKSGDALDKVGLTQEFELHGMHALNADLLHSLLVVPFPGLQQPVQGLPTALRSASSRDRRNRSGSEPEHSAFQSGNLCQNHQRQGESTLNLNNITFQCCRLLFFFVPASASAERSARKFKISRPESIQQIADQGELKELPALVLQGLQNRQGRSCLGPAFFSRLLMQTQIQVIGQPLSYRGCKHIGTGCAKSCSFYSDGGGRGDPHQFVMHSTILAVLFSCSPQF